jgi:hypothetical protein
MTYVGGFYPRGQYHLPTLNEGKGPDEQGQLSAVRKREQYRWGLLQGLWEDRPGR